MTTSASGTLAEELTRRFATLDGVRGIFPEHAAASAVLALVTGGEPTRDGLVRVDSSGPEIRISARIATSRSVSARSVLAGAATAVVDAIGPRPYVLDIEFAYID
jgi:hypothetical protein